MTPSNSTPAFTLQANQSLQGLPSTVAVSYTYLKKNLINCNSASPPTNFTLAIKDPKTQIPITIDASVQVVYPKQYFPNTQCPSETSCSSRQDSNGNAVCSCNSMSIFDVKDQLESLFENSELNQINLGNLRELFANPPYKRWSFWVIIGYSIGLIFSWIIIRFVCGSYCIIKNIRRRIIQNMKDKVPTKFNCCYKAFVAIIVSHPLLSIYIYKDKDLTKSVRALLYHMRTMILLGSSAAFAPSSPQVITLI